MPYYVRACVFEWILTHAFIEKNALTYIYLQYTYTETHKRVCMYAYTSVCVSVCVYVCECDRACICAYMCVCSCAHAYTLSVIKQYRSISKPLFFCVSQDFRFRSSFVMICSCLTEGCTRMVSHCLNQIHSEAEEGVWLGQRKTVILSWVSFCLLSYQGRQWRNWSEIIATIVGHRPIFDVVSHPNVSSSKANIITNTQTVNGSASASTMTQIAVQVVRLIKQPDHWINVLSGCTFHQVTWHYNVIIQQNQRNVMRGG